MDLSDFGISDQLGPPVTERPPRGVMPRRIWLEQRAAELARAIHTHTSEGYIGGSYRDTVIAWTDELRSILAELPA